MQIENLGNDKIKVTLTASDLVKLDVDINSLTPDSKELHTFLFRIMETIREETGFNPFGGQVVVEASPSRDGISILVSKLKPVGRVISKENIKNAVSVRAKPKRTVKSAIFYFDVFDDLCAALTALTYEELIKGSLYRLGSVYCYVTDNSPLLKRCKAVLAEFSAQRSRYPMQLTYIQEHGSLIAEGTALAVMAENIRSLA